MLLYSWSITEILYLSKEKRSVQVEQHLSKPFLRGGFGSECSSGYVIEKIFAFSEPGHPFSSYMQSIYIGLLDLLKSVSKTEIIAQNYRQMTCQLEKLVVYSEITKAVALKTQTKQTPRCFHTFTA